MRKQIKSLLWGAIAAFSLFGAVRLYFNATDDFRLSNIRHEMPYQKHWEVASQGISEQELAAILEQQFSYLGKGAQSYAFGSDDGKYVIKFFKFKHLRPSWFHAILPSVGFVKEFKEKQAARKARKLYGVFNGYKIGNDWHRKESGLLFIQLNTADNPRRTVVVRDKLGFKRTVHLEQIPFILQEKGQTLRTVLTSLLNRKDIEGVKNKIHQIFTLYRSEYRKGIYDHDHGVMYNTGFVDERPIHLDVGKMVQEEAMRNEEVAKGDLLLVSAKMKAWFQKFYPEYFPQISTYIDQLLEHA